MDGRSAPAVAVDCHLREHERAPVSSSPSMFVDHSSTIIDRAAHLANERLHVLMTIERPERVLLELLDRGCERGRAVRDVSDDRSTKEACAHHLLDVQTTIASPSSVQRMAEAGGEGIRVDEALVEGT
jgi:hypothetical protein